MNDSTHCVLLRSDGVWIRHRRCEYGPFDYEWSQDFCGVELTFQTEKFGEFCSADEFFADLGPFELPMTVVKVATVVLAAIVQSLRQGLTHEERVELIRDELSRFDFERFAVLNGE